MTSSVSASMLVPQATKRTHSEMSSSKVSSQQNPLVQSSLPTAETVNSAATELGSHASEADSRAADTAAPKLPDLNSVAVIDLHLKESARAVSFVKAPSESAESSKKPLNDAVKTNTEMSSSDLSDGTSHPVETEIPSSGASASNSSSVTASDDKETQKTARDSSLVPATNAMALTSGSGAAGASGTAKSTLEAVEMSAATAGQDTLAKSSIETAASQSRPTAVKSCTNVKVNNAKVELEDGEEPEKKAKLASTPSTGKGGAKTPEQILEHMDKTFEQRRKIITKQMPTIPELKELYPDLFTGKQLLIEFQRITKIDIDQKIQEFCVRYATAVIEMARSKKEAGPVLARWEQAKLENDTLRQYWDMVTALCLLPLHFGENFVEMVLEIGEEEEVIAQGKIVPTLVARGNIFCTDEFFLIAENTIVQEFEEFTIAFASLYSSYWVFNMVYPETIENTYNYIQRCIVRQREPGSIPAVCKNFTKTLQKWNKGRDGK